MHARHRFAAAAVPVLLVTAAWLHAGPINPPAGPIVSTNKTLLEVEPRTVINAANTPGDADSVFRITQPGSYYLAGNLTGTVGKSGIEIAADNVSIDLGGFTVQGVPGALTGITSAGIVRTGVHVRDGTVQGWPVDGAFVIGGSHRFTRVNAISNTGRGLASAFAAFDSCIASSNGGHGFNTSDNCHYVACTARSNGGDGFAANVNAVFDRCIAATNSGAGISFGGGTATGCVSSNNGTSGYSALSGAAFHGCLSRGNTQQGFITGAGALLVNCEANNSPGHGIVAGIGCTVRQCVADSNLMIGIQAGIRSSVVDCTSSGNSNDGIRVSDSCLVANNQCVSNGLPLAGAGIHATGTDNRIEGNNVTGNGRGIDVDSTGSVIVRNTASGNSTNFDIAAGNRYGPIVDITALGSPAVAGSSAAGTMTSADPLANFAY